MRIGVIKLGARISFESVGTSGGTGETISIIKMMARGGAEVFAFTKKLKNEGDNPIDNVYVLSIFDWFDEINSLDIDALCILNGNVNYFGGQDSPEQTLNYHIINSFKGPVFYILCDPALTLKQIWPSVEKKEWGGKYKRENIEVLRKDITFVSQPFDVRKVAEMITGKNEIQPSKVVHYPFEKFPCMNEQLPFNEDPEVHLSYGGTMRGGKRAKKMVRFYFGWPKEYNVEIFGKIALDDFPEKLTLGHKLFPSFTGAVNYDKMLHKMNKSISHIVIGDPLYEEIDDMAQRNYESVWAKNVVFVDSELDKLKRVWGANRELSDFLYVRDRQDAEDRLELVVGDTKLRKELIEEQIQTINFNEGEYCEQFIEILSAHN